MTISFAKCQFYPCLYAFLPINVNSVNIKIISINITYHFTVSDKNLIEEL